MNIKFLQIMIIISILPAIVLILSLILVLKILKNKIDRMVDNNAPSTVNFNNILQYKDEKLYIDGEETTNLTAIALKLQQYVSEAADNTIIENIEDL